MSVHFYSINWTLALCYLAIQFSKNESRIICEAQFVFAFAFLVNIFLFFIFEAPQNQKIKKCSMVEATGIEPATFWMQIRRSPSWAMPPSKGETGFALNRRFGQWVFLKKVCAPFNWAFLPVFAYSSCLFDLMALIFAYRILFIDALFVFSAVWIILIMLNICSYFAKTLLFFLILHI